MISDQLRTKQGPLARVWLASHWERKISKSQFLQTDLDKTIDAITTNQQEEPIALRVSGQLLLGVVRIYSRKTKYLLEDCNEALVKIKLAFKKGDVNMPDIHQTVANVNAITLQDKLTEFDILLPDLPFNSGNLADHDPMMDNLGDFSMSQDITLSEDIQNSFNFWEVGRSGSDGIEVGRRDNETGLANNELDMDAIADPLKDMNIQDNGLADDAVEFDFDLNDNIDYGADDRENMFNPNIEFNIPSSADVSMDTLMQDGIVVEDESVFAMEEMIAEPTVRRRKRLVVDRETEIPAEDLTRYNADASSIINNTETTTSDVLNNTAASVNLTMPSGGSVGSELESFLDRMTKKRRTITEAEPARTEDPFNAPTPAAGGFTAADAAAFQFDDYGDFDAGGYDDAEGGFNEEAAMDQQEEIIDEYDMSMMQNTQSFNTSTRKTLEILQDQFESHHDAVKFGELASSALKKADAAKLFYDILLLSSKDKIKVKQDRPFGEIQISPVAAH